MANDSYESYALELNGMKFRVEYHHDPDMREPWKEHDGHGIVSEWTSRDKTAGERVMAQDGGLKRYYDFAESVKIARRDGWGDGSPDGERSKGEIAASATEKDFEFLKAWSNDEWHWSGVVVTLLDVEGHDTKERGSLWGIESSATEYLAATAKELAEEIAERVPADGKLITVVAERGSPRG